MILYHFTDFCYLQNGGMILTEGLKPGVDKQKLVMPPFGVVWLTTSEFFNWVNRAPECRIKLVIPSTDRKLVYWKKWLRKHDPDLFAIPPRIDARDFGGDDPRDFENYYYCYFGTVPLHYFRAVEYADPEQRARIAEDIACGRLFYGSDDGRLVEVTP